MTASATLEKSATRFRMQCAVHCNVKANPTQVWSLLTDAGAFPSWNSTVTSLKGTIALGQTLELTVPAAPGRIFKPKVTRFEAGQLMEWSDGFAPMLKGVRTFTLAARPDGSTDFSMSEVFAGVMLPMIRRSLPDFGPAFERYAEDLKRTAERATVPAR